MGKGIHKAINRLREFSYKASRNHTKACWVLQGDVKKFFASIDHMVLKNIFSAYISDQDILWLLGRIISSFNSGLPGKGLPLGNLTSQLFCNVYMNEFDQYVKHKLKIKYYIRYADDFVILSPDKLWLSQQTAKIENFLQDKLKLRLHQDKLLIKSLTGGIDFLGYVNFPYHRVLRTTTKRRMFNNLFQKRELLLSGKIEQKTVNQSVQSYLGILDYCNGHKLMKKILPKIGKNVKLYVL